MAFLKIKSLISGDELTADDDSGLEDEAYAEAIPQNIKTLPEFAEDPTPDHMIMETIEPIYMNGETDFDASNYELQRLPDVLDERDLDEHRNKLRRQLQAVSRQLSKKILDNHYVWNVRN